MPYDVPQPGSLKRKRKRRRREDQPALSAKLYLDASLTGEVGVLSSDLEEHLFPTAASAAAAASTGGHAEAKTCYAAAVTPCTTPNPSPTESSWSLLPVRAQAQNEKPLPASTVRFPAAAHATQSLVRLVHALYPTKTLRQNSTVDVSISHVVPLPLDTILVSVDTEALQKLEHVNKRYASGFGPTPAQSARKAGKRALPSPVEDADAPGAHADGKSRALLTEALRRVHIVHAEDVLPLSLVHPVTLAPAPPAKVLSCEPVSQGIVVAATNIVIVPASDKRSTLFNNKPLLSPRLDEDSGEEHTANEQVFSATEENSPAKPIVVSKSATDMSNSEDLFDSSAEESNLSDDSDDIISLAKPGLADAPSGLSSALTAATPRPFGAHTRGVSTPGSVFSNLTSTTIRGGHSVRSKVFRAQGLIERIPNELLHPKPASDEDEEARVYVDATALTRLGCFSGDWVKIEAAESHLLPHFSAFGALDDVHSRQSRPVKVYTLPESMTKRPRRYQVNHGRYGRRDSISSLVTNSSAAATIYLSPILLVNMGEPSNINMMSIPSAKKTSLKRPITPRPTSVSARVPPTASEVTLRRIVTPISTERTLINTLYANLKQYFENKQRVVKPGDVIAIPVDESLGRSVYEGDVEQDGSSTGAILSQIGPHGEEQTGRSARNVAWFAIEDVSVPPSEDSNEGDGDIWGNVASIDPCRMMMRQSGDERRKLPSATSNAWQYYLGLRKVQAKTTSGSGLPEASQPYVSPLQRRLRELISVSISPRAVHLGMPPLTVLITSTQRNIGKARTVQRACADIGIHYFPIDAHDIVSEGGAGVDTHAQGLLEARCERALECGPEYTAICITHLEVVSADRAAASLKEVLETCRVLIATTTDIDRVPDSVRGLFTHELEMSAPDEGEREGILRDAITESGVLLAAEVDLGSIAVKTAALVAGDLVDVVDRALVAKAERLESLARSKSEAAHELVTVKDIQISGGAGATSVTSADFDAAVDLARKNFADSIGAPKIPNVQWSDVGGLTNVKDAVIETIQLPLSRPELFAKGLKKRSGILFYGPPGTGKTLLAKAIATEFSLNFFSVKGPELLNMYIGESEANVRRVFQRARDARPCVVFFDELDSVAPKRGNQGDSGGVMDRIVSQLLAELDGMSDGDENGGGVFVIGATNRPDLLDQALLRPGRFDKMLYLSISDTHAKQAAILEALTRKFTLGPSVSLARVAETLPFTFTGADLYALCSDAMLKAVTRSARQVDARVQHINAERASRGQTQISVAYYFDHYHSENDTQVMVTEEDFIRAKEDLVPSVSVDELRHYERVRASFEGATKKPEIGEAPPVSSSNASDRNGQGVARPGVMQAVNHASMGKATTMNGNARSHGMPTSTVGHCSGADEDDFVIRTDQLSLVNHNPGRSPSGKAMGKGKGKSHDAPNAVDVVASNQLPPEPANGGTGEDLYD